MAYCRKVPVKKVKLQTFEELLKHLWTTFERQSTNYQRVDIAFNIYLESSRKQQERERRGKEKVIEIIIANIKQAPPVEMDKFWGLFNNKMQLQEFFIE